MTVVRNGKVWGNGMKDGSRSLGSPRCPTCKRQNVDAINKEIAMGVPLAQIAIRHKIALRKLREHKDNHVITSNYTQGLLAVSIKDVMSIPMSMQHRRIVQDEIVEELLEPMTREGPASGAAMLHWQFLLGIWKLQMQDEQVVMRILGVLPEQERGAEISVTERAGLVRGRIDTMLKAMIEEGGMPAERARAAMSQFLAPDPQLPMGRVSKEAIDAEWSDFTTGGEQDGE